MTQAFHRAGTGIRHPQPDVLDNMGRAVPVEDVPVEESVRRPRMEQRDSPGPVNLERLAREVTDPLKELARAMRALTFDERMDFCRGVSLGDDAAFRLALKVSEWTRKQLNLEETTNGKASDADPAGRQDAGEGNLGDEKV